MNRIRTFGDDQLVFDTSNGYSPYPEQTVYRVTYNVYDGLDDDGRRKYFSMCVELFTNATTAMRAFDARVASSNPERSSGITLNLLKQESLGDILGAVLAFR